MQQTDSNKLLNELEKAIQNYVRPDTFPLALRVMKKEEPLPDRVKRPYMIL